MATTNEKTLSGATSSSLDPVLPPPEPPPPKPPDPEPSHSLTTFGSKKDDEPHYTLEPFVAPDNDDSLNSQALIPPQGDDATGNGNVRKPLSDLKGHTILHVRNIPIEANYETLATSFSAYGKVDAIRMDCNNSCQYWDAWITFSKCDDALKAKNSVGETSICDQTVLGTLVANTPRNLDVYKPARFDPKVDDQPKPAEYKRTPLPPTWIVVKSKEERCNFFLMSRHLQKKVGHIQSGDITRFGKNAVLIHAKSKTQSIMLLSMKIEENDILKEITPHLGFSYGKGVVFNEDLHAFPEQEILEMCPSKVWNVKKAKNNMIILTFVDPEVPSHINVENERLSVRHFKPN